MRNLFFLGIILTSLLSIIGCSTKPIDRLVAVNYIYKNQSGTDLTMEVYNLKRELFRSFTIPNNGEVETNSTKYGGPVVFFFEEQEDLIGDSLHVKFADDVCIYYIRRTSSRPNVSDEIFDIKQYDNYSEALLEQSKYTLYFTFTEADYQNAEPCN